MIKLAKKIRTQIKLIAKRSILKAGKNLHLGRNVRLWAPDSITIGNNVYIGGNSHIEANCIIGNYCLIANEVALVGKYDHDYTEVGVPIRYSAWVGNKEVDCQDVSRAKIVIDDDVWIGFRSILLSGVTIGKGSVIAAGSIVTSDIPPYSIAAGIPAKVIAKRFTDEMIQQHERLLIDNGYL